MEKAVSREAAFLYNSRNMMPSYKCNANLRIANRRNIRNSPDWHKIRRSASHGAGFTMVEMVIIIAILILVSGILLANFPALSSQIRLQRSSQGAALTVRRAQNMAFAVRQVATAPPRIPFGFGLYFGPEAPANSFLLYADLNNDGLYRPPQDFIVETLALERGVTFLQIIFYKGATPEETDVLNVVFSVPEARMSIKTGNPADSGVRAEVVLAGGGAATRRVVVRNTGQVYSR